MFWDCFFEGKIIKAYTQKRIKHGVLAPDTHFKKKITTGWYKLFTRDLSMAKRKKKFKYKGQKYFNKQVEILPEKAL